MSDKIWIIKEGLEIHGPFNQAEIIAQINNKEILETDQIASPFSRFEFLKNCEEFNLLFKIIDHTEISKTEQTAATEKISQVDPSITGFLKSRCNLQREHQEILTRNFLQVLSLTKRQPIRKKLLIAVKK